MRKIVFMALALGMVGILAVQGRIGGQAQTSTPTPTATSVLQPPPPPPPPGATATPTITPTPTSTPTPTPTATPVPLTLSVRLAHGTVAPRASQKVSITTLPGASISILVTFPNGDTKTHTATANSAGTTSWSYKQPGSRITHSSRTGKVTAEASSGTDTKRSTKRYTIGFARLDVSVQPRKAKRGKGVGIWVHTGGQTDVEVVIRYQNGAAARIWVYHRSSADGWSYSSYAIPSNAARGRADIKGYNLSRSYPGSGESSFRVQ